LRLRTTAAAVLAALSAPAWACQNSNIVQGPRIILNEDFRFVDDAWGRSENFRIAEARATATIAAGGANTFVYSNSGFGDVDVCVAVIVPEALDRAASPSPSAGLVFWAQDAVNHYSVHFAANNTVAVYQLIGNRWTVLVPGRIVENLRLGAGETNTLRVVLDAGTATIFVNNERFAGIRGQLPDDFRGRIGVFGQAEPTKPTAWVFSGLRVTNLPTAKQ
jgi:hypothetical protein